jgi:ADP-ribose pyrophosphatase
MAIVFKSRVFAVEVTRKRFPSGREHEVTVVRHAPSVVLIPMTDEGRVVLVRQFRASVERELWELPAGGLEPGESAEAGAARECEEEIGLVPGHVERLSALYPAPGFCDEILIFLKLSQLTPPPANSPRRPDDDEEILAESFNIDDAKAMVERGEIVDLKSAYALTLI